MRTVILDYGAGNIASVEKASPSRCVTERATDVNGISTADRIVLPGVGHFSATRRISAPLRQAVASAIAREVPFLGICVGLQWLFEGSDESLIDPGLGFLRGTCLRLPATVKVPHVGWNTLDNMQPSWLLNGISPGAYATSPTPTPRRSWQKPSPPRPMATPSPVPPCAVELEVSSFIRKNPRKPASPSCKTS